MPKYLMLDHGGVLDDRIVSAAAVTKNDIVLGQLDEDNVRILKNGVQIVNTLNQLVSNFDYQVVYHSSNGARDQLNIHNELVHGAKAKGLVFPPVIASAAPDKTLTEESPENPKVGTLGATGITFLSYANGKSKQGKSCVRAALASHLRIPEDERKQHIVFDDGPTNIDQAGAEGYRTCLIGGNKGTTLDVALTGILRQELRAAGRDEKDDYSALERKQSYSILWPSVASGVSAVGLFTSNSVATAGAEVSWGLFAKACAAIPVWGWAILLTVSAGWLAKNIYKKCTQDTSTHSSEEEQRRLLATGRGSL